MLTYEMFPCKKGVKQFIVLLHGFGGNYRIWKDQIPLLQKHINVLAINLPSHSIGNKKLTEMKISIEAITQEILKILDLFSIKNSIFMGVSLGTIFIKYIEMHHPEYVLNAIMVGAIGTLKSWRKAIVKMFSLIGDKIPFHFVYRSVSKIIMPAKTSERSRRIFCKCAKNLNAKEFKAWMKIVYEAIAMNIQFKKQKHLQNLYITGIRDIVFIKQIKKEVEATKAQYIEMLNCGHVCNMDKKEEFNTIIEKYLLGIQQVQPIT